MKSLKQFLWIFLYLATTCVAIAQNVPQGINYQAVLRDAKGEVLPDQTVRLKVSILDPETKSNFYTEKHAVTTNQIGMFTLTIGAGQAEKGKFSEIPWASSNTWLEVAYDTDNNGLYDITGTTRMLTVPYAFYAERAGMTVETELAKTNPQAEKGDGFEEDAWLLKGNHQVDDQWNYLGTANYADLVIKTHEKERIRITKGVGGDIHDALINLQEDVRSDKSMEIIAELTVGGKTVLESDLIVVGNSTFQANVNIEGNTLIEGTTRIMSQLDVDKDVVINGGLNVRNGSEFESDVKINHNLFVYNDAFIARNTDIGKDLHVGGNADIDNDLNVDNDTHIGGDLDVDGNGNVDMNLHVGKDADINNNLNVDNDTRIGGDLDVDGNGNIDMNLHVGKDADIDNNLNVDNDTRIGGDLDVDGNGNVDMNLHVGKDVDVDNNLNVDNDVHIGGDLDVDLNVNIDQNLTVQQNATILGGLDVAGEGSFQDLDIQNNLTVGNNANIQNNLDVSQSVTVGVDLTVTDDVTVGDDLTVSGISLFEQSVTMESNLTVQQNLNVSNSVSVTNDVTIGGDLIVENPITANCRLIVNSCVSGSDSDIDSYPMLVQGGNQGIAIKVTGSGSNDNNYVSFWDASDMDGRIEGQTYSELINSFPFIWTNAMHAAEEALSIAMVIACGVQFDFAEVIVWGVEGLLTAGEWIEYNVSITDNVGVSYESGSGDYAEWLERVSPQEDLSYGEVVGVTGGKISRNTIGVDHVMVVSKAPIVLGNMPEPNREKDFEKVAFMGQVPVRVMGKVSVGDYILPSGYNDGLAKAVAPARMRLQDYNQIVGVAWESGNASTLNMVNVAVGLNQNDMSAQLIKQQAEIDMMKQQLNQVFALLGQKAPYEDGFVA
jgi:UDP-3-O-[3-hydroxymyristoyl] glucosamine N-acyltransferase